MPGTHATICLKTCLTTWSLDLVSRQIVACVRDVCADFWSVGLNKLFVQKVINLMQVINLMIYLNPNETNTPDNNTTNNDKNKQNRNT